MVGETPNLAARLQALAEPGTRGRRPRHAAPARRAVRASPTSARNSSRASPSPIAAFRVADGQATESRFEALHGAAPDATGRARARARPAARPLAPGLRRRGPGRPARRRAGHRQVAPPAGPARAGLRRAAHAAALLLLALPSKHGLPPHPRPDRAGRPPATATIRRTVKLAKLEALFALSGGPVAEATALTAALLGIPTEGRYPRVRPRPARAQGQAAGDLAPAAGRPRRPAAGADAARGRALDRPEQHRAVRYRHRPHPAAAGAAGGHVSARVRAPVVRTTRTSTVLSLDRFGPRQSCAMVEASRAARPCRRRCSTRSSPRPTACRCSWRSSPRRCWKAACCENAGDRGGWPARCRHWRSRPRCTIR